MSFLSVQWIHEYESLKIKIRIKRQKATLCSPADMKDLTSTSEYLSKNLQIFQSAPMEHEITASEIARRQVILDNLKKQLMMIPRSYEVGSSERESFGIDPSRTSNNNLASTFNPIASVTSNEGLVQRQKEVIKQQDEMIIDIGKGVDVLHNQALEINQEAKVHKVILDKLDVNVDKASEALKAEAEHAEKIRQASSICFMYIIIILEVVIIVIMLIFMFTLKK